MSKELKTAILLLIIILSSFTVPYLILTNVHAWYGSFLFWIVATCIVIAINFFISKDWSK